MRFRWVTARKAHTCAAALTHGPHPIRAGERYVRVTIFRSLIHESGIGTVKFCAQVGLARPDIPDDPLITDECQRCHGRGCVTETSIACRGCCPDCQTTTTEEPTDG